MKQLILILLATLFAVVVNVHSQTKPTTFRVMTFNIHHGEGLDGKVDLERIAALIMRERVDIVALQEVDRGVARTARRDLPVELAKLTGMNAYFDRNIGYQGGDYGNAVLTRFPVKKKKNTHYKMLRPGEQRGVQQLLLNIGGQEILFMNTHIDYRPDDAERLLNAEEMRGIVKAAKGVPVILCGDFNSSPKSRTHEKMKEFLSDSWEVVGQGNGWSFPADKPRSRIDFIWVTPDSLKPVKIKVLASDASDHLPVIGEFRFRSIE